MMRAEYDFSKGKKNPYAKRLKKQITIRLDEPTIERAADHSDQRLLDDWVSDLGAMNPESPTVYLVSPKDGM